MPAPVPLRTLKRPDHHVQRIPVLALMTHSRCNCRCLMYDIWKGNRARASLSMGLVERLVGELRELGVEEILLSGGEPMMHADLWSLCAILKAIPAICSRCVCTFNL